MVTLVILKRKRKDVEEEAEKSVKSLRIKYAFDPVMNCHTTQLSYKQKENKRLTNLSKLCDHTLHHSVKILNISGDEQENLNQKARVVSSMEDIDNSGTNLYNHNGRYTKLRPFAREFLKEVSIMFTLYVYTMGSRGYARQMVTILDPQSVYFKPRVISKDGSTKENQKNLDVVVGADERNTIIIDDTPSVWKENGENLIHINRYNYFTLITGTHKALKSILEVLKCVHRSFFEYFPRTYVEQDYKTVDVRPVLKKVCESSF
ncbi:hypothetical protein MKX01_000524 [Papaver californicum]|nr:hypothetical protein MKX01_000524 [Papaver californicum]